MTPEKQRASQGKFTTPLQRPLFVEGASGERAAPYEGREGLQDDREGDTDLGRPPR